MITNGCRNSEGGKPWVKDAIYTIGTVKKASIKYLFFVYGSLYAADKEVYERIRSSIEASTSSASGIKFSETKELGRINGVDPLGITDLRIRGMWQIAHPFKAFDYIPEIREEKNKPYTVYALIPDRKFREFNKKIINSLLKFKCVKKYSVKTKDPNNPANLIDSVLLKVNL